MEKLTPPLKKYITGAFPTHSLTSTLHENFVKAEAPAVRYLLQQDGYVTSEGKPTKKAAIEEFVDSCEGKALWRLGRMEEFLASKSYASERQPVNQTPVELAGEPRWVNLATLGTYFNVTGVKIGRWLSELGLREEDGMATAEALEEGLANTVEMLTGVGKQTRKITQWNLAPIQHKLMEAGHPLDFNYEATLKGRGKNSDVAVETVDDRARKFAQEFARLFKDKQERRSLPDLVSKTPKPIQKKAEELLQRPGFITQEIYKKHLDRA